MPRSRAHNYVSLSTHRLIVASAVERQLHRQSETNNVTELKLLRLSGGRFDWHLISTVLRK
jgi:hypothetical protein